MLRWFINAPSFLLLVTLILENGSFLMQMQGTALHATWTKVTVATSSNIYAFTLTIEFKGL